MYQIVNLKNKGMDMDELKILDCTLRDGGYYNNWDFEPEVVAAYLESIALSKIEYVELGLRNFSKNEFLGAFAYTTEAFINSLDLPEGPTYGVMVDAKTILDSELNVEDAVNELFVHSKESRIDLVRIAAHFKEVEYSGPIVKHLKKLGYIVGLNLMQAGGKENNTIADKARQIKEWNSLDVLYFADSLGNMDGAEVARIVNVIRTEWEGPLGIHTHNNMGKGLDNTLTAASLGVTWLDTTITGMGRGAGNTQTESLLAVFNKQGSKYNSKPIYELVIRYFESMQKECGWGSNLLYFLGAQNDVHPTYIQNLLSNSHYGTDEIVGAIDYLSNLEGTTSYNGMILDTALDFNGNKSEVSGDSKIMGLFNGKDILIITNAPSTKRYAAAIELYIKMVKPIVISVNIVDSISPDLINYYVISHNSKFLSDTDKYKKLTKPVILPKHRFNKLEMSKFENNLIFDYGVEVTKGKFTTNHTYVTIPYDITTAYVLGLLLESEVKGIAAIGFDGYQNNDVRQQEMNDIFTSYNKIENSKPIVVLTPTTYSIGKGSIYAPVK
jgi:4-hydroxy 2-oxovalerate aldolase